MSLCVAILLIFCGSSTAKTVQTRRAYDFWHAMGVNTAHWVSDDEYRSEFDTVKARLKELDIRYCRDGLRVSSQSYLKALYDESGIKFIVGSSEKTGDLLDPDKIDAQLDLFDDYPEMLLAIQGPNEPDGWLRNFNSNWISNLRAYQLALFNKVKGRNNLMDKPVLGPPIAYVQDWGDDIGDIEDRCDYGSFHPYSEWPEKADSWTDRIDGTNFMTPTKADWISEFGWRSPAPAASYTVSEDVHARYVLRGMTEYFRVGIPKINLYDLIDTAPIEGHNGFGLLRKDLSKKPSFSALRDLIAIIKDTDSIFSPESLSYTLDGDMTDVRELLLQKGNGEFLLILWQAKMSWNFHPQPGNEIDIPTRYVNLDVQTPHSQITMYDPQKNGVTGSIVNAGSQIGIDDRVTVYKIAPPGKGAYNGPHAIPGRIEVENYDEGGEGVSYYDSDVTNHGNAYRFAGVDIKATGDTEGGGYDVGWTVTGEWMEYTINTVTAGTWNIHVRAGSGTDGASINLTLDDQSLGTVGIPNLNNWSDKQTVIIPDVELSAATDAILRLEITGDGADINWVEFVKAASTNLNQLTLSLHKKKR